MATDFRTKTMTISQMAITLKRGLIENRLLAARPLPLVLLPSLGAEPELRGRHQTHWNRGL
jgi:hypothetical protein